MSGRGTFDAATSVPVAVREAVIRTIVISGTEGHTDVGDTITVRLVRDFTTVSIAALLTGTTTREATSIASAVRSASRAVGVDLAGSADTSSSRASRLARDISSIEGSAVSVGKARLAGRIGLTIGSASVSQTSGVIGVVSGALERISATSTVANGVGSHGERSIVGYTVGIVSTSNASTILVTILSVIAITVTIASG